MRNSVGEVVWLARQRARLTLATVANAMGVSAPYLSDVEHDRRALPLARWPALVAAVPGLRMADMVLAATTAFLAGPEVEAVARGLWDELSPDARLDLWRLFVGAGPGVVPEDEASAMRYACAPATWRAYVARVASHFGSTPAAVTPVADPIVAVPEAVPAGGLSATSTDETLVDLLLGEDDGLGTDGMALVALCDVHLRLGRDPSAAEVAVMADRVARLALALAGIAGGRGHMVGARAGA